MSLACANPEGHSNRLIHEKSPYLLQHAGNPVNWYPWGEDAFAKAGKEKKPIFLSIGYATCHWCHVMAHESFEDDEVAGLLNRYYIAVKVDREERPDVDKIYMSACQSLTRRGGWPLSIFMTPEGRPFFAGSYFPKSSRMGMPGFIDILQQISAMWQNDRESIVKAGENITTAIQPRSISDSQVAPASIETLKKGYTQLARAFDPSQGGFGAAPKFPTPHHLTFLLRWYIGDLFCQFYNITDAGNFEKGCSIPRLRMSLETFALREGMELKKLETALKDAEVRLFDARKKRVHPLKDDKILTSWNGLMIAAFAKGCRVFGDQAYADAAADAAGFILRNLKRDDGRLLRRYRQGEAAYTGYLDDYAFLTWGLIELYEATFKISYLEEAIALNEAMINIFWDKQGGGLYFTGKGNESLITRSKDIYDGALPSGNSVAALNFLRLGRLTGNTDLEKKADQLTRFFAAEVAEHPMAYTQLLAALDFMVGPSLEIVIAGDPALETTQAMIRAVRRRFLPNKVLLLRQDGAEGKKLAALSPFVEPMHPVDHQPAVYLCEQYSCRKPITKVSDLESALH